MSRLRAVACQLLGRNGGGGGDDDGRGFHGGANGDSHRGCHCDVHCDVHCVDDASDLKMDLSGSCAQYLLPKQPNRASCLD